MDLPLYVDRINRPCRRQQANALLPVRILLRRVGPTADPDLPSASMDFDAFYPRVPSHVLQHCEAVVRAAWPVELWLHIVVIDHVPQRQAVVDVIAQQGIEESGVGRVRYVDIDLDDEL